jgi:dihydroorotate dehydrogenase
MEALHVVGMSHSVGEAVSRLAGVRVVDSKLNTTVAGIEFENPLVVGAGEDKPARSIDGFHMLGFGGVEVGTVTLLAQPGNPRPRLFTHRQGVALNRMGFNSPGAEAVARNLEAQRRLGVVGINAGKNKMTPPENTAEEHAAVIRGLWDYGDYFVVNLATPNTPGARDILRSTWLPDILDAAREAAKGKPLFVKTTVDLTLDDLDMILGTCIEHGISGIVDTNTTISEKLKARYGWYGQDGGVSGNDPEYRRLATERMKHITRETRGMSQPFHRIGVGAINSAESAVERLEAGAEILQVVTANRQLRGLAAPIILRGILRELERRGLSNVRELVGSG